MDSINKRIQLIIDQYYNGNVTAFSREVGVTQSTIRDIVSGRKNSPSSGTIEKILNVNTLIINSNWLLTGKGEMLKDEDKIEKHDPGGMIDYRDDLIKSLKGQVKLLEDKLEKYESEKQSSENGQKRKAS